MNELHQIHNAALAVICSSTSVPTRTAASSYLEQWNATSEAWQHYSQLLEHPDTRLLFLQLLQAKIRRETPGNVESINHILETLLMDAACLAPASICLAAMSVKIRPIAATIEALSISVSLQSLKVLQNVPLELRMTTSSSEEVTSQLQGSVGTVLRMIRVALPTMHLLTPALQALLPWIVNARITVTQLHTSGLLHSFLPLLRTGHEDVAQCLEEALLVPTDSCTESRNAICQSLVQECLSWSPDESSNLICTLICEEIDNIVNQPATDLLKLLLSLQQHPSLSIRCKVLEVWLTVSDIAVSERHANWGKPLYAELLNVILGTISMDEDEDDRDEYRRLLQDVLVAIYFMLRSDYLETLINRINTVPEPCVFGLVAVAREAHARVISKTPLADKGRTKTLLRDAISRIVSQNHQDCIEFVGAYAKSWSVLCGESEILSILQYLQASSRQVEACRAAKSVLVSCSSILRNSDHLSTCLSALMDKALLIDDREPLTDIVEGCTRVIIPDKAVLLPSIMQPILVRAEQQLKNIPNNDPALELSATESLSRYLHALGVIIRFCDYESSPLSQVVNVLFCFLDNVSQVASSELLFGELIAIHQLLLKNAPLLVAPHFEGMVKYVVEAFEVRRNSVCLEYLAVAVEKLGPTSTDAFKNLLDHVSGIVLAILQRDGPNRHTALVTSYFELVQRYLLYCPIALVNGAHFSATMACSVECLEACHGERDSTRAALNFLTRVFSWQLLPSPDPLSMLVPQLAHHGARTVQLCVAILLGGTQPLWPACTDCIYAVMSGVDEGLARSWMEAACGGRSELVETVVGLLLNFAKSSPTQKAKAKMLLTDFSKIKRGELSVEAIKSYC